MKLLHCIAIAATFAMSTLAGCSSAPAEHEPINNPGPVNECNDPPPVELTWSAPCETIADCGSIVCVTTLCIDGQCDYERPPNGSPCTRCDTVGTCVNGVCVLD